MVRQEPAARRAPAGRQPRRGALGRRRLRVGSRGAPRGSIIIIIIIIICVMIIIISITICCILYLYEAASVLELLDEQQACAGIVAYVEVNVCDYMTSCYV